MRFSVPLPLALLALLLVPPPPFGVAPPFERVRAGVGPLAAGVHAPDQAWEEADYALMAAGRFEGVKMMSYHRPGDYGRLRREHPALDFAVRLDSPWNELPPPADFVAFHAPRLRALVEAGFSPWVEIGNEPNLELHPGAEAAFATWYAETLRGLRGAVPELRYGFPGLAVDQRELAWLDANAEVIRASDWLAVHAYWKSEREMLDPRRALKLVEYHRRFPRLPLLVTEAGNNAPGVAPAERARQYARFTRTVARYPYVRALHYFILSGTVSWRMFHFDAPAVAAVRNAPREPVPVLSGAEAVRRDVVAALVPLIAGHRPAEDARPRAGADETGPPPPIVPVARRRLIADPAPAPAPPGSPAVPHSTAGRWVPAGSGLRSASAYLATDLSLRFDAPAPVAGVPFAVQVADGDMATGTGSTGDVAGGAGGASVSGGADASGGAGVVGAGGTGFALLWDGGAWRLQYRRAGTVLEDHPLVGVPEVAPGGRLRAELALEPRSAAAWVWPLEAPQPHTPHAVFVPPAGATDAGAGLRHVVLPAPLVYAVANVSLEGLTRFS